MGDPRGRAPRAVLSTGSDSPVSAASFAAQRRGVEQAQIGGHEVACIEEHDVARHQLGCGGDRAHGACAPHLRVRRGQARAAPRSHARRATPGEADRGVQHQDREDCRAVDPLAEQAREHGRDEQRRRRAGSGTGSRRSRAAPGAALPRACSLRSGRAAPPPRRGRDPRASSPGDAAFPPKRAHARPARRRGPALRERRRGLAPRLPQLPAAPDEVGDGRKWHRAPRFGREGAHHMTLRVAGRRG